MYILKNIKCPKCNGSFISYKSQLPNAQYYYDCLYLCGSCNARFNVNKISEMDTRHYLSLRESKK